MLPNDAGIQYNETYCVTVYEIVRRMGTYMRVGKRCFPPVMVLGMTPKYEFVFPLFGKPFYPSNFPFIYTPTEVLVSLVVVAPCVACSHTKNTVVYQTCPCQ